MNKSSNGGKVRELPNAKAIPPIVQPVQVQIELGSPAPKDSPVPEGWIPYMLYFVDFSTGVRLPIVSKEAPETVEKWARTLKSTIADGKVVAGTYFQAMTIVGPVAKPPEGDFNPSNIILPKQETKPVSQIILK